MTVLIQNFSVPAGDDVEVTLEVTPDLEVFTLEESQIFWRVYPQAFGIPIITGSPAALIEKSSNDGSIVVLPSPPMTAKIKISGVDTSSLLRNYYHETTMIDFVGSRSTLNCGVMTVTQTGISA